MTRLALVADLHFGSVPPGLDDLLLDDILSRDCDALIVAGDLTMSATEREFEAARRWLDKAPIERLVVPGNHDIPKFNLFKRFFSPFERFERAIGASNPEPLMLDCCGLVGINTVAPWQPHLKWQEGRVRKRTVKRFSRLVEDMPKDKYRIAVAHHPFAKVPDMERARPVRRAVSMVDVFHETGVDLVLSGHTHQSYVLPVERGGGGFIAIGAPTALSSRTRGEENGYWLIGFDAERIMLTRRLMNGSGVFDTDYEKAFEAGGFRIGIQHL